MNVFESFRIALNMLRLHKLRAFLTMVGVIIGVMSVTIITMISNGFQVYLAKEFSKIGSDTLYLSYNPGRLKAGETLGGFDGLTPEVIELIRKRVPEVAVTAGYRELGQKKATFAEKEAKEVRINAIDPAFIELNSVTLTKGRHLNQEDLAMVRNVCTISDEVEKILFPSGDSLGKLIQFPGIVLEVVGVTEKLELMGNRNTKVCFVPLSTANQKWVGDRRVDLVVMKAKKGEKPNDVMDKVWVTLMGLTGNKAVFELESSENVLKVFQGVVGVAGTLLAGIAALSLLVGGIGIMNIMLVSVTERTREIGLRKAVGAPRRTILLQFLIEAATLSLVGGLIGMGIAYGLGLGVTALTVVKEFPNKGGLPLPFPITAALGAAAFSAIIGVVFGFFPALSASKLDPIVALRTE